MTRSILIVTIENDLHALAVRSELEKRNSARPYLLEVDRLNAGYGLSWELSGRIAGQLRFPSGDLLDLREIDLIWWRRSRAEQRLDVKYDREGYIDLINQDWRGSLLGALTTLHRGQWVSTPGATNRASNKLWQLSVARRCGFRVPNTIVSNDPAVVRPFAKAQANGIVVKPVAGTKHELLFTRKADLSEVDDATIEICPAIYQEYIPGSEHIRLNCFGQRSYGHKISTEDLDWRRNLNVPIRPTKIPAEVHDRVQRALSEMDLAMGIVDLKITPGGEVVWFEVNPQGQFLFLEGITKDPLLERFADFLLEKAQKQAEA